MGRVASFRTGGIESIPAGTGSVVLMSEGLWGGTQARRRLACRWIVSAAVAVVFGVGAFRPAAAETLLEALAAAYATNPQLNAQRAALRATDEEVPRAKSGFRPRLSATANAGWQTTRTVRDPSFLSTTDGQQGSGASSATVSSQESTPTGYSITLTQNLFNGFQDLNAVREAKATVYAARETLRVTEQSVLLAAVTAYVDVIRDQAIVGLAENNVSVLSEQLKATRDRFDVGEVTRTDVAQAEASLATARSELQLAQANLKASRASYELVMGHPPNRLHQPSIPVRLLPTSLDEAIYIGDAENPSILAAAFAEEAANYALKRTMGQLLPQLNLEATYSDSYDPSDATERQETGTIMGRLNVPLYQGGAVSATVRQAKNVVFQRRRELDQARVQVRAAVVAGWGRFTSAQAQIESDETGVRAATVALAGVREEEKVGQRTVLDVLNAQQALLNAQVTLETTRRDYVVAAYTLLAAVGRLSASRLSVPVELYDPLEHYERVQNKWWGFNAEPLPALAPDGQPPRFTR